MLLSVKMKNEAVSERSQTRGRAGLGVNGMIDKFIYKQHLANVSTNDSLGEALLVISKETVGNSCDISSAILGHKYHQNHLNRSSE